MRGGPPVGQASEAVACGLKTGAGPPLS